MALIKCPECGKEVSNNAKACPHCGAVQPEDSIVKPAESVSEVQSEDSIVKPTESIFNKVLEYVFYAVVFLVIAFFWTSCSNSCSGSGRSSDGVDYSERAQELGASTEEYTDAYNYWKYDNP